LTPHSSPKAESRPSLSRESVAYTDNQPPDKRTQAWADNALYTPADSILLLSGIRALPMAA